MAFVNPVVVELEWGPIIYPVAVRTFTGEMIRVERVDVNPIPDKHGGQKLGIDGRRL